MIVFYWANSLASCLFITYFVKKKKVRAVGDWVFHSKIRLTLGKYRSYLTGISNF